MDVTQILKSDNLALKKSLFTFNSSHTNEEIIFKFNIWSRYFFPNYFTSKDAPFHEGIDLNNLKAYKGEIKSFTDIAFRGASKTSRTKLFIGFVIANDEDRLRKYIKVLSADDKNGKQIVTDVYNMFVQPRITEIYQEVFQKTSVKREETMGSFTTSTGVKLLSGTVGTDQRGAIQENSRPDLILFEDFETRKTLRSAVTTKAIWDNMEEARTSLSVNGSCIYNCNYISEAGNVHKLVEKENDKNIVLIQPIIDKNGVPAWKERYTVEDIEQIRKDDDDFEGERLCEPSAGFNILFDRKILNDMSVLDPIKEISGLKFYSEFNRMNRYAGGCDVSGGVGLDSSATVIINFDTAPAHVSAVYSSNTIKPDVFGDEIDRQSNYFGKCLMAPEVNNHGHATIARCKQLGVKLYVREQKDDKIYSPKRDSNYGWQTNTLTKPKMLFAVKKAIEDGLLVLNDQNLINEFKSYSRDDLMDKDNDPRLITRHFDLLIACAIAWQMKDHARYSYRKRNINKKPKPKPRYMRMC